MATFSLQKLRNISAQAQHDQALAQKITVIGAFTLYLDFINLFLYLLQLLGKKKNSE